MRINIKDCSYEELERLVIGLDEKPFRARQIAVWLFNKNVSDIDCMTDLSKSFRKRLKDTVFLSKIDLVTTECADDGSKRFLFSLNDGNRIESVIIKDGKRITLCISTQVGCKMGCTFCNTGRIGFIRDLDTSEILDQIFYQKIDDYETRITNIVFMGMGEPLDNYDNLIKAVKWIIAPIGLKIPARRVTISTCGLIPRIEQLGRSGIKVNIAVSLNAVINEVRTRLMPINKIYPLEKLIETCNNIPLAKGRRITYEYVMIDGISDSERDAIRLAKLLRRNRTKINLICFNRFSGCDYKCSAEPQIERFRDILLSAGFTVMVRMSKGREINSACGQLTAGYASR